jgi:hypothetical protein
MAACLAAPPSDRGLRQVRSAIASPSEMAGAPRDDVSWLDRPGPNATPDSGHAAARRAISITHAPRGRPCDAFATPVPLSLRTQAFVLRAPTQSAG